MWGPLEADFQRHYGIDLSDVWRGGLSPRRFAVLFDGMLRTPDSLTLSALRRSAPPPPPKQTSKADMVAFFGRS